MNAKRRIPVLRSKRDGRVYADVMYVEVYFNDIAACMDQLADMTPDPEAARHGAELVRYLASLIGSMVNEPAKGRVDG